MFDRFAVSLPDGLHNTNVGNILADSLPLTSMLCCLPTLTLFLRHRRVLDLVVLLIGFVLACIYHVCHMAPEGLVASRVMGISGPVWRSLDVLYAQWLLSRTFGHAIGASHAVAKGVANGAFPALLVYHGVVGRQLSVGVCGQALLCALVAGLTAKLVLEGYSALPGYPKTGGCSTAALFVAAFVAFPMPELYPRHYWLFHSLWHAFLGAGYYELYAMLLEGNCNSGRPVSSGRDTCVQSTGFSAWAVEQTGASDSCTGKSEGTVGAANIVASSGGLGCESGASARYRRREAVQPFEAAQFERANSGAAPLLQAERVRLWSRSLQRLSRLVCLHA